MADQIIGEAAQATAAEGGAVVLIPNEEAEAAEQEQEQVPEAPIILEANPTIIVEPPPEVDHLGLLAARLDAIEARLLEALSSRGGEGTEGEVGPPPEPLEAETVIEPTEEVAPKADKAPVKPTRKHAGFWI